MPAPSFLFVSAPTSMVSVSPDGPDPFFPARGRAFAGLVLGGLYLAIVAGTFFPVQLLNPGLRKAGGFI